MPRGARLDLIGFFADLLNEGVWPVLKRPSDGASAASCLQALALVADGSGPVVYQGTIMAAREACARAVGTPSEEDDTATGTGIALLNPRASEREIATLAQVWITVACA